MGFLQKVLDHIVSAPVKLPVRTPPDPVVDITELYALVLRKENIERDYFKTCQSHRETIAQQVAVFDELYNDARFWTFISNRRRRARMPIHLRIENSIKSGIPPNHRSQMWQTLIGTMTKVKVFKGIYSELFLYQKLQPSTASEIARDVGRTFPALGEPSFTEKLSKVLIAYSLRNPQLGYCQAMNFLAGTLLIFMEEENAFWMLTYIVEELLPNYYVPSMSGLLVDTQVFEWLVADNLPELWKHFQNIHMSVSLLSSSWFLCLFVNYLPTETTFLVWDNLMFDGIVVLFEVGLALLRMHQNTLLRIDDPVDVTHWLHRQIAALHNPKILWTHWKRLDKKRILTARQNIRKRVEADSSRKIQAKQLNELEHRTHFGQEDLEDLWTQYTAVDAFLRYGSTGLDQEEFGQLVAGTFSEWWVDHMLVRRLFLLCDTNDDGFVDFSELIMLLSIMSRGTFRQKVNFNFHLFDVKSKGKIDKFDVYRMLQSVYAMFLADESFYNLLRFFVDMIFESSVKNKDGSISVEHFADVVSIQPQIMLRFKARNPTVKYDIKKTYYYWMFDTDRVNHKHSELIHITLDRSSSHKASSSVPMHVVFIDSQNL